MPRERKSQKGQAKTSPNSTPNARAPTKAKKRKASANNANNGQFDNMAPPPPQNPYNTMIAANPFDDYGPNSMNGMVGNGQMHPMHMQMNGPKGQMQGQLPPHLQQQQQQMGPGGMMNNGPMSHNVPGQMGHMHPMHSQRMSNPAPQPGFLQSEMLSQPGYGQSPHPNSMHPNNMHPNAMNSNGMGPNGMPPNGMGPNGMGPNGMGPNGMGPNNMGPNNMGPGNMGPGNMGPGNMGPNGMPPNGIPSNIMGPNGMGPNGMGPNGMGPNGMVGNVMPPNGPPRMQYNNGMMMNQHSTGGNMHDSQPVSGPPGSHVQSQMPPIMQGSDCQMPGMNNMNGAMSAQMGIPNQPSMHLGPPNQPHQQQMTPGGMLGGPSIGPGAQPMKSMPITSGKVYPPDQTMIFNSANPNAPPIYPCGACHKEVHENEQGIFCESGCNFWFHRACVGLSEHAFTLLNQEVYAEWVCDTCTRTKNIPLVKFKP